MTKLDKRILVYIDAGLREARDGLQKKPEWPGDGKMVDVLDGNGGET
jgi:hypothetical protein